jgi:ABC-type nitrate/sulfonate/bicarbonate transport system substrate-binding protein
MNETAQKACRTCKDEKPATAYRGTRSECLACENQRRRAWYAAQHVKPHQTAEGAAYYRAWYEANAEVVKARAVAWAAANQAKRREVCKENMARQRDKLSDAYVRRMLAASVNLKAKDIPDSLVKAQRELLKLKRAINEKRG